jgi:hypothetical protein
VSRWLTQTRAGGGALPPEQRGDCVPACIASILGLPIGAIANTHGEGWWDRLQAECGRHGYCLSVIDSTLSPPPCLWVASVPSLNLPADPDGKAAMHVLVVRGYEFVHDPSMGKRYDGAAWVEAWNAERVVEGWVLCPLDPAQQRP